MCAEEHQLIIFSFTLPSKAPARYLQWGCSGGPVFQREREREREMYANPRKRGEQFVMWLLITYGDTGAKGALKDDHVLASAKCQVSTKYPTNALINRPALISYIISMKIKNCAQLDAALSFLTNTVLRSLWCRFPVWSGRGGSWRGQPPLQRQVLSLSPLCPLSLP
ncbi:uncharacterized protein [Triticum aestivum]|uniref:uncharacterized protein isoform X3 n=1 Tax=Triticum aestivum TaxID=4565 RepID=UPI001D02A3ED|nr:uncharacterized protein LOC123072457 isoform X3 [Triticum aestivum]